MSDESFWDKYRTAVASQNAMLDKAWGETIERWQGVVVDDAAKKAFLKASKDEIDDHMEQCMRIVEIDQFGTEQQWLEMHVTLEACRAMRACMQAVADAQHEFMRTMGHVFASGHEMVAKLEREATR